MNAVAPVKLRLVSRAEQCLDRSRAACPDMNADCEPHGGAALRSLCADWGWPVTDQSRSLSDLRPTSSLSKTAGAKSE